MTQERMDARISELEAALKVATDALDVYALLWVQEFNPCMPGECVERDLGQRARDALAAIRERMK